VDHGRVSGRRSDKPWLDRPIRSAYSGAMARGVTIDGADPALRLTGRIDQGDAAGPRFAWSGSSIEARFSGSRIAIRLRGSSDHFGVTLDGVERPVLVATPAQERYPVADGLSEGAHHLSMYKRTEPLVSETQLLGVELAPGGELLPLPPRPSRRIELIGDSVTAGFGVLGDRTTPFSPETEDFGLSYGSLTARALGAEAIAVAWSGRGACRNYADEPGDPMPVLYERTLPSRADSRWDFTRWAPHLVVINLGTNDFSLEGRPVVAFVDAYHALLRRVRSVYAAAHVLCAVGPVLEGEALQTARACVAEAVQRARAEGMSRLQLIEHPVQAPENGYGCDGHPSATTHRLMAEQLTAVVRAVLGW
jgi:lysophospholipase L1-like esterase